MSAWADEIEADLRWRESELVALKALCAKCAEGSDAHRALLRALWALMYAHYEGFHKFCWDLVLDRIEAEKVTRAAVKDHFAKLSLANAFRQLRGDTSPSGILKFFREELPAQLSKNTVFEEKLETQSNLWPNVARENSKLLDLEFKNLDLFETKLKLLVSRRNDIAHGKKLVITKLSEYQEYEKAALLVMHELALQAIDCLGARRYLAFPALPAP